MRTGEGANSATDGVEVAEPLQIVVAGQDETMMSRIVDQLRPLLEELWADYKSAHGKHVAKLEDGAKGGAGAGDEVGEGREAGDADDGGGTRSGTASRFMANCLMAMRKLI